METGIKSTEIKTQGAPTQSIRTSHRSSDTVLILPHAKDRLMKRFMRWLCPDQRAANRIVDPPLIAYLGTVRGSAEFRIGDFSLGGFLMITAERWMPETSLPITLERTDPEGLGQRITVCATVVRTGENGVGFSFVPPPVDCLNQSDDSRSTLVDHSKLAQFLKGLPLNEPCAEELERAS